MGSRNTDRMEVLRGPETVIPYFQGFGEDAEILGGAELEIFLMRRAGDGFAPLSDYENFRLVESIQHGDGVHQDEPPTPCTNEPDAGQLETQSRAYTLSSVHLIGYEIATNCASILRKAQDLEIGPDEIAAQQNLLQAHRSELRPPETALLRGDVVLCPFAVMPFRSPEQAMNNIITPRGNGEHYSDRPRLMMEAFRRVMSREAASYPVSNTAVHFTHGAKTLRHAFEMTRLQAALMPFLFVLTENRPPYQGTEQRVQHHSGIRARLSLRTPTDANKEQRGLFPDFLFAARDEHDFLNRMLERVMHAPLLAYYDHDNRFSPVPVDRIITPLAMQGLGPENVAQFELAMSEFWWAFKYKLPRNNNGLFHELRDFDSGPETVTNIALIGGMLAMNEEARAEMIERLDRTYGIPVMRDPESAEKVIRRNLYQAYHRGNDRVNPGCAGWHLHTPFGAKGHTMRDFLQRDLLPMLQSQYGHTAAAPQLENLDYIAHTGMTNAQLWNLVFESAADQQRRVHNMTQDAAAYHMLANQGKGWAQLYEENRLPALRHKI